MFNIYTTSTASHRPRGFVFMAGCLTIALCSLSVGAWAAPTFVSASDPGLPDKARGIPKGGALNVQNLALDTEGDVTLELVRFSVFADDAKVTIVSDSGSTQVNPPGNVYFRGWANHDPNSIVVIAISEDGSAHGVITGTNGAWLLESHPGKGKGLSNRKVDMENELSDREFSCGAEPSTNALNNNSGGSEGAADEVAAGIPTNVTATAHIIVDTDYEYFRDFGFNPANAIGYIGDLFAYSSAVYEREIDTNLQISSVRLFSTNTDPYSALNAGCGAVGALDEVQDEWDGNATPRTLVHLISGKDVGQGCAYLGVLCHQSNGYGASMGINTGRGGGDFNIDNPTVVWDNMVVAHEIGHNFDSPHTHNYCNVAGNPNPVDKCVVSADDEDDVDDSCTASGAALPGLGSLTGGSPGAGNGTIMSYCHFRSGGFGNFSWTFGEFHTDGIAPYRVPDRMRAHVAANLACMDLQYTGPDLAIFKDCKPDSPALVGSTGICTIVVENKGTEIALGVVTEDLFVSNATFNFGTVTATKGDDLMDPATCTASANPQNQSGDVSCDLGDLAADHKVTIKIPVTATSPQNVNDRVTVDSESPDPNPANNSAEDELNFVARADLQVFKDCKPDGPLLTGVNGTCTIIVQNFGPSAAANVHVVDTHVSNQPFTIDSVVPAAGCSIVGGVVTCDYPTIAANASKTFVVNIAEDKPMDINDQVVVTSNTEDPDTSNNTAADGLFIREDANLLVTKDCKPDGDLLAGVTGTCEILVTNLGPSAAANVKVVDTHTSNVPFTIDAVVPAPAVCAIAGAVVTCNFASLASGASQKIVVSIAENNPQDINDTVSVSSDMFDSNLNNNIAADGLHIVGVADLSITKTDAPDPVVAGQNLTYTLTISNTGPSTAEGVVVNDAVPAGTSMVSAVSSQGSCNPGVPGDAAQPTVCTLGNILSGGNVTVTIVVTVLPGTTGTLHNTATVSSATQDPDNANNSAAANTTVDTVTGLSVTKTDDQDPVIAGTNLKYTVEIANAGPSTATQLSLVDTLPAEVSLVGIAVEEGSGNCLESALNVVTCDNIGDLAPGARFRVVITVLVDASVPHGTMITNDVAVLEDAVVSVSTSEDTTVNAQADIWIDKTGVEISGGPQRTIRYKLTVYNKGGCEADDALSCGAGGPSDAQGIVVVDTLPATAKKMKVPFVSQNCVYSKATHKVTCTLPQELPAGQFATFTIDVQPVGNLGPITNSATVTTTTFDPKLSNNTDVLKMVVQGGSYKPSN